MVERMKDFLSESVKEFFSKIVFSSQGFPIIITLTTLGILLVLFRMKSVEQDYKINQINEENQRVLFYNKDLKAKKADRLSVNNLRDLAEKYNLQQPKQNQVIVIP